MKHYMKLIRPEQGYLNQASATLSCRNVQIIPIRRKYGAGEERVRGGGKSNYKMSAIR